MIVVTMDDLGRLVIPSKVREALRIKPGDQLSLRATKDSIILSTSILGECIFCGTPTNGMFEGKSVCDKCRQEMAKR